MIWDVYVYAHSLYVYYMYIEYNTLIYFMAVICTVTSQYQEGLLQVCHQRTSPWAAGKVEIACTTCRLSWRMLQQHHFPCRVGKKHIEISKSLKPVTKNIQIQYLETYFNRQIMPQIYGFVWTYCPHAPVGLSPFSAVKLQSLVFRYAPFSSIFKQTHMCHA